MDETLSIDMRRRMLARVLENLRHALYCLQASNGIERGNPAYTSPQIFPLAKDALYWHSVLLAAKAFDHHARAASFLKLQDLYPEIAEAAARTRAFDPALLDAFADKLRKIRNRALAHDDLDELAREQNVWEAQAITTGEFVACVEFAFHATNDMLETETGERVELINYTGMDAEELARTANKLGLPQKWAQMLL